MVCSVLTGGQNIDGCRHSLTQASYLASPPMVLAYTLAGTVCIDFENEPLGMTRLSFVAYSLEAVFVFALLFFLCSAMKIEILHSSFHYFTIV